MAAAPAAQAFVRETTGYATGAALHWDSGCVVIAVPDPRSSQVTWDELFGAVEAAAASWTAASASCGGGFKFQVAKSTANQLVVGDDGVNAVIFREAGYCDSQSSAPRCDPLSLAVTWFYDVKQPSDPAYGTIRGVDIEINAEAYQWAVFADGAGRTNDLQSMLVHELGHVLGLDHTCYQPGFGLPRPLDDQGNAAPDCSSAAPVVAGSVMFPRANYTTGRTSLTDDDARGVCSIYSGSPAARCIGSLAPAGGCALAASQGVSTDDPTSILCLLVQLVVLVKRSSQKARRTLRLFSLDQ